MLVKFAFKNYRSFKDMAELSMVAEPLQTNQESVLNAPRYDLLLAAGIFGANASGKSNVVKALAFLQGAITKSNAINMQATSHPLLGQYLLNSKTRSEPSHFDIIMWNREKDVEYQYVLEIDREKVVAESLHIADKKNKNYTSTMVFSRSKQKFSISRPYRKSLDILKDKVLPQALAVNVFAQFAEDNSINFVRLIDKLIIIDGTDDLTRHSLERLHSDAEFKSRVEKFICNSDVAISEIGVEKVKLDTEQVKGFPFKLEINGKTQKPQELFNFQISTTHMSQDEENTKVVFNMLEHESMGTRRLLGIAALMFQVIEEGSCLIIDEFGSSMHPLINQEIVNMFNDRKANPRGGQLIFTTHDTFMLSDRVSLRRDQIWFTEKDVSEESKLSALSEYKVRADMRIDKNYLEGRFGAVPITRYDDSE